ncbi:MAG: site-specific integrase [Bacteroidales bacterium]|nr:site-specific integrase [Bacteroidales bacterium]
MSLSFSQVAALWKADKLQYVKKSTYAVYSQLCNAYILPAFDRHPLLDEDSIQAFANSLLNDGYAIKTVKDTMLVLKMLLRFGEKIGAWTHIEFTVRYSSQAVGPRNYPTLSDKHLRRLLKYLQNDFSFENLGILICLHSGLRIGEVCGLQWKDLDTTAGVIHVNKTVQRIYISDDDFHENFVSVDTPKTKSSIRDIPLSKKVREAIRPFKRVMHPEDYLLSGNRTPMEPRVYRRYFQKLLRELKIPPVRFHALRHSFATRCIANRCDYKTVSAILGHSSISTTLDMYVHPGFREKKQVIDKMSRILEK